MSKTIPDLHLVTLRCKSAKHAEDCLAALKAYGRPDAMAYGCRSYEFGRVLGDETTVLLAERWEDWGALDRLLTEKVVPALPTYNALLERDFDPARDTRRISLA
jgi:quinol monooxygenase YgiN